MAAEIEEKKELGECQACGYPTLVEVYKKPWPSGTTETKRICTVCANTRSGSTLDYPAQYLEDGRIINMIAFAANVAIDAAGNRNTFEEQFDARQREIWDREDPPEDPT